MNGWTTAQQLCRMPTTARIDMFGTSDLEKIITDNTLDDIQDKMQYNIGDIVAMSDNTPGVVVGNYNDLPAVLMANGDISIDGTPRRTGKRCDIRDIIADALTEYDDSTQHNTMAPSDQLLANLRPRVVVDINRQVNDGVKKKTVAVYCPETGERWDSIQDLFRTGIISRSKYYEIIDTGRQYNGRSYRHC